MVQGLHLVASADGVLARASHGENGSAASVTSSGWWRRWLVGPANYPIRMKTNYNEWSLLMKIKLEAWSLWAAMDKSDAEFQVDRMAFDAICSAVPTDMITTLAVKPMAKEAWDCIKTIRIGDDRVRKATM
jgi:hypothetical protein